MENQEIKNVTIGVPSIKDSFTEREKWEKEWEKLHSDEPNNRQKIRRMNKDWEKHDLKKI